MSSFSRWLAPAFCIVASSASAGEEILYAPPPGWVLPAQIPAKEEEPGAPLRLLEQQIRLEDGVVSVYSDTVVALDSPQALTAMGTLSANWLPDKGDLTIHRAELIRDGRSIDLLASAKPFQVLRREAGLESRLLDGMLTATMPVAGARVGDLLRLSYSVTTDEQALGDHMQWIGVALPEPVPLASGRIVASWPQGSDIRHTMLSQADEAKMTVKDGYKILSIPMPVSKMPEMPGDAPMRYRMPPLIQVGNFADWKSLSSKMAPLFEPDGSPDMPAGLAQEIAKIERASSDSLARAALATQLVQDEISYLLNGMEGGNYIPQSAAETWANRYGDCKAKSLLLLAMLRHMGIESQAVLVNSRYGDALPAFQPMAAAFDHVIVKARIDGRDYWLDGTSSGSRLANIGDAPRFYHGLPLTAEGSDLTVIPAGPAAEPAETIRLTIDQRAGIEVPALYDLEMTIRGIAAAAWKAIAELEGTEQFDDAVEGAVEAALGMAQITERSVSFDDDTGDAVIHARGLVTTAFRKEDGQTWLRGPQSAAQFGFDIDRARAAWREIPVIVRSPVYHTSAVEVLLPKEAEPFRLTGSEAIDMEIGGNTLETRAELGGDRYRYTESIRSHVWEIPAADLPRVKREVMQLRRALPQLEAPTTARRMWEYNGKDRAALAPIERAYATLIAESDADDATAYANRASFRTMTGDFEGALADLDRAIAIEPSAELYGSRSVARANAGDLDKALADAVETEALASEGSTHEWRIKLLGLLGRGEESIEVADDFGVIADDPTSAEMMRAEALGWAGRAGEGREVLEELVAQRPDDAVVLNALCWHVGRWGEVDEETIAVCTRAVETTDNPAAARDSRALAYYRAGRHGEALADLDAVLATANGQQESRYLRGVVRLAAGNDEGRRDIAQALFAYPLLARTYASYGIET